MKTGGPAFPVDPEAHKLSDIEYQALSGMSLRDYFAAKAMQMLTDIDLSWEDIAREAYKASDAMLAARDTK